MFRYAIELAFNGTKFHGWQKQENAKSVQEELDGKLSLLLRRNIETLGCGRTDAGVHAKNFVAHFDSDEIIDGVFLTFKLNRVIDAAISVYKIWEVSSEFNARFDAKWREYEYVITTKPNPFLTEFSWLYQTNLNLELMNMACELLLSKTNFESFSKVHTQVNNFNCDLHYAKWQREGDLLVFTIRANRFLRNMVRAIVGTLIQVGLEKISIEQLDTIIESRNRSNAGASVPAKGLFLTKVVY